MEKLHVDATNVRAAIIKASITVAEVLRELGRPLDITGTQQVFCPNPQHPERRPSARYYEDSNHIYCFKCNERWDPVGLVRVYQQTSTAAAIDWIALHFRLPELTDMAPTVIATLTKPRERQDYSHLVTSIEAQILQRRAILGADRYHRCWIALDTAREAYTQQQMDDDSYEQTLTAIATFAGGPEC